MRICAVAPFRVPADLGLLRSPQGATPRPFYDRAFYVPEFGPPGARVQPFYDGLVFVPELVYTKRCVYTAAPGGPGSLKARPPRREACPQPRSDLR